MAKPKQGSDIWDSLLTLFYAVLIAIGIRTVAYEPFHIPSASMVPTLLEGDYVFVSKFSYGYSRYSVMFAPPVIKGRLFERVPERGDVVVFRNPGNLSQDYIKRLMGLPGDRIQMRDGEVWINGERVARKRLADFEQRDENGNVLLRARQYEEALPNGKVYRTLDGGVSSGDNTDVFTVPAGHYFMMGDNRDNSADSRFAVPGGVGFIPAENLIGRAEIRWLSTHGYFFNPFQWRFDRMFTGIE